MNALKTLLATAVLAIAAPSFAGTVIPQLTFETIGDFTNLSVAANNPYATNGVTFSGNAFGVRSSRDGAGSGNFFRDPVNLGALVMFNDTPTQELALTLTVERGFADFFSIEYTGTAVANGWVEIYDEKGTSLKKETLKPIGACPTSTDYLCVWDQTKFEFAGVAHTIKLFGSASGAYFFDNIQLGLADPGQVPEPSSFALGFAALAALGVSRRRKQG